MSDAVHLTGSYKTDQAASRKARDQGLGLQRPVTHVCITTLPLLSRPEAVTGAGPAFHCHAALVHAHAGGPLAASNLGGEDFLPDTYALDAAWMNGRGPAKVLPGTQPTLNCSYRDEMLSAAWHA